MEIRQNGRPKGTAQVEELLKSMQAERKEMADAVRLRPVHRAELASGISSKQGREIKGSQRARCGMYSSGARLINNNSRPFVRTGEPHDSKAHADGDVGHTGTWIETYMYTGRSYAGAWSSQGVKHTTVTTLFKPFTDNFLTVIRCYEKRGSR